MDVKELESKSRSVAVTMCGLSMVLVLLLCGTGLGEQGMFFAKKTYVAKRLPRFDSSRAVMPSPVFDEDPNYVDCYWKAWEIAFRNFHEPAPDSGFVSQFIDAAFNQNIFLWDTCFMTMFCNYAYQYVPGICSLDNFYAKQHETGEICREIRRNTGVDFGAWVNSEDKPLFSRWGFDWAGGHLEMPVMYRGREVPKPNPRLTLDSLNHPIFAWAELESYRITGDERRLNLVWEPLVRYYDALQKYIRQGNGLYMTDAASMDNATRNPYLKSGGTGIDISCEMVLFARNLAEMARVLDKPEAADRYESGAEQLSQLINRHMWDPGKRFYFDLTLEGERAPVKSIAAFWTLLARVATEDRARDLVAQLENPKTFHTAHRVPTLAADEPGFDPMGAYWNGAVWAPTEMMVVRGLENYGYHKLAREIAANHLRNVVEVFKQTGTLWENYAPQQIAPGRPAKGDFVGWTGIGPIALFIEYAIGVRADAAENEIAWHITSPERVGIERFWFAGNKVSLMCERPDSDGRRTFHVEGVRGFRLKVNLGGRSRVVRVPPITPIQFTF